jgi:hypothetical protein
MPTNLSPIVEHRPSTDPRFRPGAYITDGRDLYCVQRSTVTMAAPGCRVLVVEDCMTTTSVELEYARVARLCTLVRPAPGPEAATATAETLRDG